MSSNPNWFLALAAPAADWFARCVPAPPEGIRLFHPGDLHITIAFLGDCGPESAQRAWQIARQIPAVNFDIRLGEVVPMGNPRRYSALSALLVEGGPAIESVMQSWREKICLAAGARLDTRPPKAHLTLARPPWRALPELRESGLQWAQSLQLGEVRLSLSRLALYTRSEDRSKNQFQIVEHRSLGARV
jgi:RNA 2',3'-cyclic 3'-phosphodiesterase